VNIEGLAAVFWALPYDRRGATRRPGADKSPSRLVVLGGRWNELADRLRGHGCEGHRPKARHPREVAVE
jgi:hypothetical protein